MTILRKDLDTLDLTDVVTGERLAPVSPGDVLLHEFMEPMVLSARAVARSIEVPANRITEIINGERAITADTALRFQRLFGASAEFWMNLQSAYDLEIARGHVAA